jgi:predicted PurR-regulated permease PerM
MGDGGSRARHVPAPRARIPRTPDTLRRLFLFSVAGLAFWLLGDVLLLVFAAVLLSVALHGASESVARRLHVSPRVGLIVVALLLLGFVALGVGVTGPQLAGQGNQLWDQVIATAGKGRAWLEQFSWGRTVVHNVFSAKAAPDGSEIAMFLGTFLMKVFGVLGAFVVVIFTAFFFAASPDVYRNGALRLLPPERRERGREVMESIGMALRSWMFGQSISMVVIAIASYAGLALLGIPMAPLLAIIAGITNVAPYIGPFLGAAPALLVAFGNGPQDALYVALLFFVIQFVEGNVLQPLIQNRTSKLPPATTILAQTVLGTLFGIPGVMLATPLLAASLVSIRMLYVEDCLGDRESDPATA